MARLRGRTLGSLAPILLALAPLGGCFVDTGGITFAEEDDDNEVPTDPELIAAGERLVGQWATPCIEGTDDGTTVEPGQQYVYDFDGDSVRIDRWSTLPDCTADLWVQTIQADYVVAEETDGNFELELSIDEFEIYLLSADVADGANAVEGGFLGRTDWVANRWIDLLGFDAGDGELNEDDRGSMLIRFLMDDREISASLLTVGGTAEAFFPVDFGRVEDGEDFSASFLP